MVKPDSPDVVGRALPRFPSWAEITLQSDGILTVERWAYDDAGGSIAAGAIPAPGALGLLALAGGAAGIRRKRQA